MWKMVCNDLRHGFYPGIKRILKQFANYYFYLYFIVIAPVIFQFSGHHLLVYYAGILPMLIAMLLAVMYGAVVNKAFYLCPLSSAERRRYFIIAWGIRTGIPVLLSVFLTGLLLALHDISPQMFCFILLTVTFFSAAEGMYGGVAGRGEPGMAQEKRMPVGYTVWRIIILFLGIFTMVFWTVVADDREKLSLSALEWVFFWLLFFSHILAVLFTVAKYSRLVMERTVCYENAVCGRTGGEK